MLKNNPDGWNFFFLIQIGQWGERTVQWVGETVG